MEGWACLFLATPPAPSSLPVHRAESGLAESGSFLTSFVLPALVSYANLGVCLVMLKCQDPEAAPVTGWCWEFPMARVSRLPWNQGVGPMGLG